MGRSTTNSFRIGSVTQEAPCHGKGFHLNRGLLSTGSLVLILVSLGEAGNPLLLRSQQPSPTATKILESGDFAGDQLPGMGNSSGHIPSRLTDSGRMGLWVASSEFTSEDKFEPFSGQTVRNYGGIYVFESSPSAVVNKATVFGDQISVDVGGGTIRQGTIEIQQITWGVGSSLTDVGNMSPVNGSGEYVFEGHLFVPVEINGITYFDRYDGIFSLSAGQYRLRVPQYTEVHDTQTGISETTFYAPYSNVFEESPIIQINDNRTIAFTIQSPLSLENSVVVDTTPLQLPSGFTHSLKLNNQGNVASIRQNSSNNTMEVYFNSTRLLGVGDTLTGIGTVQDIRTPIALNDLEEIAVMIETFNPTTGVVERVALVAQVVTVPAAANISQAASSPMLGRLCDAAGTTALDVCDAAANLPRIEPPAGESAVRITGFGTNKVVGFLFKEITADKGPAIRAETGADVTISCNVFEKNKANDEGGAIHLSNASAEIVINCFRLNKAGDNSSQSGEGGALVSRQSPPNSLTVKIKKNLFQRNDAQGNAGGAIFLEAGKYEITENDFIKNRTLVPHGFTAPDRQRGPFLRGGAMYIQAAAANDLTASIQRNVFLENEAFEDGGAIRLQRANFAGEVVAEATIAENEFVRNRSNKDDGGAISLNIRGSATLTDNKFVGNQCDNNGGAIHATCSSIATMSGDAQLFSGNKTKNTEGDADGFGGGAGVYGRNAQVRITGAVFEKNLTDNSGGAVFLLGVDDTVTGLQTCNDFAVDAQITSCTFNGNVANKSGGAIYLRRLADAPMHCAFSIDSCSFDGNVIRGGPSQTNLGSAIYLLDCNVAQAGADNRISDCIIQNHGSDAVRLEETTAPSGMTTYRWSGRLVKNIAGAAVVVINASPNLQDGLIEDVIVGFEFFNAKSSVKKVTLKENHFADIVCRQGAHPTIDSCTLDGLSQAFYGIYIYPDSAVTAHSSNIKNHKKFGVNRLTPRGGGGSVVDCTNNYWGNAGGPNDPSNDTTTGGDFNANPAGDQVTDNVKYRPFATTEFP